MGRASGALIAAASGSTTARELISQAETASIATGVQGTRAVIVAAAGALASRGGGADGLLASARRSALQAGLPRLPSNVPAHVGGPAGGDRAPAPGYTESRHRTCTVRCFGGFHLCTDDVEIDLRVVRPQARALLRMLALNAGSPLHRELIADILWGDLGTSWRCTRCT